MKLFLSSSNKITRYPCELHSFIRLTCTHVRKKNPVALTLSKNFVDYFHRIKHLLFFYDLLWMTHFKVSTIKLGYSSSFYSYTIQLHSPAQLASTCQFSNGCWCAVKFKSVGRSKNTGGHNLPLMIDIVLTGRPKTEGGGGACSQSPPPPLGSDSPVKKNCGVTQTIFQFHVRIIVTWLCIALSGGSMHKVNM